MLPLIDKLYEDLPADKKIFILAGSLHFNDQVLLNHFQNHNYPFVVLKQPQPKKR